MLEENLRRALNLSHGDWTVFLTRPISGGLLAIAVLGVALMLIPSLIPSLKAKREEAFIED